MKLSPDQVAALQAVREWWADKSRQTFTLAGHAGTGKTTIIRNVVKEFPAIVAAPTGKAAYRLREIGVPASTIHKLAYRFQGEDQKGRLEFEYKGLDEGTRMVIIDESSMLSGKVCRDLMETGYRMLFVGDPGQLPPVLSGDDWDPEVFAEPEFTLTEIHRHKDNRELLDFAHGIRGGDYLPEVDGEVVRKVPRWHDEAVSEALSAADVTLCLSNQTRRSLNLKIMKLRGLIREDTERVADIWPQLTSKTFRIIGVARNYPDVGLYNGSEAEFTLFEETEYGLLGELVLSKTDAWTVTLSKSAFLSESINPDERHRRDRIMADFGYALTAHKSQGSEWGHVAVFDDTFWGMENHARWCYTAATRAKARLTWIHNGPSPYGPCKIIKSA